MHPVPANCLISLLAGDSNKTKKYKKDKKKNNNISQLCLQENRIYNCISYKFIKCYYNYRGWKWFLSASADLHINFFKQNMRARAFFQK